MPVPVQCEQCQAKYLIEDRFAGKRAKCKRCGNIMSIPLAEDVVELDDTMATDGGPVEANPWGGPPALSPPPPAFPQGVTSQPPRGWRPQDVVVEREGEVAEIPLSSPFPTYAGGRRKQIAPLDWLVPLLLLLFVGGNIAVNVLLQVKLSSLSEEQLAAAGGSPGAKLWLLTLVTLISFFAIVAPLTLGGLSIASKIMKFELPASSYARAAALASLPLLFVVIIGILALGGWADEALLRNLVVIGVLAILPLAFFTTRLIFGLDWVSTIVAFLLACVFGGIGFGIHARAMSYAKSSLLEQPAGGRQRQVAEDTNRTSHPPQNQSGSLPSPAPSVGGGMPQVTAPSEPFVPRPAEPRRTSESNLRILGGALNAYYAGNNNTWPPDLAAAQSTGIVGTGHLKSPYGPAAGGSDYAYIPGPPNTASATELVLAYDRAEYEKGTGATVLFADLTVRWMDKASVDRALTRSTEVAAQYASQPPAPPETTSAAGPPPAVAVNTRPPAVVARPPVGPGAAVPRPPAAVPGRNVPGPADAAIEKQTLDNLAEKVRASAGKLVAGVDIVPLGRDVTAVVRPLMPSTAFAVVRNAQGDDIVEVWTGSPPKKSGQLEFKVEPALRSGYALSADGQRLMRVTSFPKLSVKSVSVADGRELASVDLNAGLGTPAVVGFAAGDRAVIRWEKFQKYGAEVVDFKSRKVVKRIDLPEHDPSPGNEALSPDGRYFATTGRGKLRGEIVNQLVLHALVDGGVTRRLPVDALGGRATIKPAGIAFAPDGSKVAALFTEAGNGVVVGWTVKTSKPLTKEGIVVPGEVKPLEPLSRAGLGFGSGAGRSIAWLAGGGAWLVGGSQVLDAADGRLVGELGITGAIDQIPAGEDAVLVPFKETFGAAGLAVIKFDRKALPAPAAAAAAPKPAAATGTPR